MFIYLDIETSGLEQSSFMLQLSAITDQHDKFDIYIRPPRPLSPDCTKITGLSFTDGFLYKDGTIVSAVGLFSALSFFRRWTESLQKENQTLDLIGYNSNAFDIPILVRAYSRFNETLPRFNFCYDLLPAVRKMQKTDKKLAATSIKLEDLGRFYLPESDLMTNSDFHNSLFDCELLKQVAEKICKDNNTEIPSEFGLYKKPFEYFIEKYYNKRQF